MCGPPRNRWPGHGEQVARELVLIVYGLLSHQHPQSLLPQLLDDVLCHAPESPPSIHRYHGRNRLTVPDDHQLVLCVGYAVEKGGEVGLEVGLGDFGYVMWDRGCAMGRWYTREASLRPELV